MLLLKLVLCFYLKGMLLSKLYLPWQLVLPFKAMFLSKLYLSCKLVLPFNAIFRQSYIYAFTLKEWSCQNYILPFNAINAIFLPKLYLPYKRVWVSQFCRRRPRGCGIRPWPPSSSSGRPCRCQELGINGANIRWRHLLRKTYLIISYFGL
jgi:hypothetical protein